MTKSDAKLLDKILKEKGIHEHNEYNVRVHLDFSAVNEDRYTGETLYFVSQIFNNGLSLSNLTLENFNIEFVGCSFGGSAEVVNVHSGEYGSTVYFYNCEFSTVLNVSKSKISYLELEKSSFNSVRISGLKSEQINIHDCDITKRLNIVQTDANVLELINSEEGTINQLMFLTSKVDSLQISSLVKPIKKLYLSGFLNAKIKGLFDKVDIRSSDFESIQINSHFSKNSGAIKRSQINKLYFEAVNFSGLLSLDSTDVNELVFTELNSSEGGIRLNEVMVADASFSDCMISNFYWNQLNFVNPPEIVRCDLGTLKMSNVQWPKNKRLKDSFLEEKIPLFYGWRKKHLEKDSVEYIPIEISDLRYQRDTYRQLKAASIANHNTIESLEFYKNEMILYWKEIRLVGGQAWYDRILVFVNRWVSNFGQSWHMPFLWLFFFHFVFYSSIISWNYFGNALNFSEEVGQYLYLINPAHRTPEYINTGWGQITEFFMRVFSGFFIFHFIKASRKFGKV